MGGEPVTASLESAARFRASYERRNRARKLPETMRADELAEFRALVLSKVGRLTPKWPTQLWREVDDELGDVCPKRIERALRWLREQGEIVRTADGYLLTRRMRRTVEARC